LIYGRQAVAHASSRERERERERENLFAKSNNDTNKRLKVNNTKYSGRLPEKHRPKPINAGRL